jgi:hypothetical protein
LYLRWIEIYSLSLREGTKAFYLEPVVRAFSVEPSEEITAFLVISSRSTTPKLESSLFSVN